MNYWCYLWEISYVSGTEILMILTNIKTMFSFNYSYLVEISYNEKWRYVCYNMVPFIIVMDQKILSKIVATENDEENS